MVPDVVVVAALRAAQGNGSSSESEAEPAGAVGTGNPTGAALREGPKSFPGGIFFHTIIITEGRPKSDFFFPAAVRAGDLTFH
jgi:hypothetical protein